MFIRIKKIKNKKYAYLVENHWIKTKKSTKQKTKKYLGRVFFLQPSMELSIKEYFKISNNHDFFKNKTINEAILDLVRLELYRHSFKKEKGDIWFNDEIKVDMNSKEVLKDNQAVCISLNQGFLNEYTLKELSCYKIPNSTEKDIARSLATLFISSGISLEPNFFVNFFQQYVNNKDKTIFSS